MKRLAGYWKWLTDRLTARHIATGLAVFGMVILVAGVINEHCECAGPPDLGDTVNDIIRDFYANVSVDCLSVAFGIFVINRLNERRAEQQEKLKEQEVRAEAEAQLKAQLIRDMGHPTDTGITHQAVRDLQAHGWLYDGSLYRAHLREANLHKVYLRGAVLRGAVLRGAILEKADLRGANLEEANLFVAHLHKAKMRNVNLREAILQGANLEGAYLRDATLCGAHLVNTNLKAAILCEAKLQNAYFDRANLRESDMFKAKLDGARELTEPQLVTVSRLQYATLPDASLYNGRLILNGDIKVAKIENINPDDPAAMASFYGVSLEEYLAGQEWAREHLADLRRKAGLDPDTGLPVEPTNGVEPQPADAPALRAPRRNGHKASMVTHRVRR